MILNKILILLVVLVLNSYALTSQSLIDGTAESVGMSQEKLDNIERFIQKYMFMGAVPGGTFLIARRGKVIFHKSFGNNDLTSNVPYANDDVYRIMSMSKIVTTVAALQLVERGMLGLDDPIHYYIPAFKDMEIAQNMSEQDSSYTTVPAKNKITVRHLMTHTSGITYGIFNPGAIQAMYEKYDLNQFGAYHETLSTAQMADMIGQVPLMFEPGQKWMYGLNMEILGRVIEVASGQTLDKYFRQNIFDPLGMDDTWFYLPKEKHDRLVPVFTYDKTGKWMMAEDDLTLGNSDFPKLEGKNNFAGGGGLSSTAMDYAIFITALMNNGVYNGTRILGRKTIETMVSDQLTGMKPENVNIFGSKGVSFGLGGMIYKDNGVSIKSQGTYEWGGYFNTKFFIDPEEELIFVGMSQIVPFQRPDFWDRFYNMIYSAIDD